MAVWLVPFGFGGGFVFDTITGSKYLRMDREEWAISCWAVFWEQALD